MKQWKIFNAALLACCSITLSSQAVAEIKILDRVAAIVDDDIVLLSELEQRITAVYAQIQQSDTQPPPPEVLRPQVLERLISERLQLTMGYNAGIRITDAELNEALGRIASNAGMSSSDYLQAMQQQGSNVSAMREQIRHEMILMRVQQAQVMRRIRISPQELDNFLESEEGRFLTSPDVNVGQILLSVPTGATVDTVDAVAARAQAIYQQAQKGDFRQLAMAHSADQTALEGGDLGWRKLAQLPGVFIEAVKDLEVGAISAPIRSDAGYHLLKLYERRGGGEQLIEQHFARHILMAPNQIRDDESTVDFLEILRQNVADGEDFAVLAKEHSEDAGSALNGGELGWSTPGMFVPEFEQTMNTVALNEISRPFMSQFGWHIMQVTERRKQDFSEDIMRNRAQNMLRQRKYEEELQVWLQEIRDEAFIEIKTDSAS